ncbi:MAG: DUF3656 domain-containing protein [Clostridiaceae bacterium]|nr:DUF3656 domain-containing protein [Clostridiaceae bacterium]
MTNLDNENELLISFNRGGEFSSHYFEDDRGKNLHSGDFVGHYGIFVGEIVAVTPHKGLLTAMLSRDDLQIRVGDTVAVRDGIDDVITFPVGKIDECSSLNPVQNVGLYGAHPDQLARVKPSFSLYLVARKKLFEKSLQSKLPVNFRFEYHEGDNEIEVDLKSMTDREFSFSQKFAVDPSYSGGVLSIDRIIEQLSKSGETSFHVTGVDVIGDLPNVPVSFLNHIRRVMLDSFAIQYAASFKRSYPMQNVALLQAEPIDELNVPIVENHTDNFRKYKIALEYINLKSVDCHIAESNTNSLLYVFSVFDILNNETFEPISDFFKNHASEVFAIRLNASSRFLQDQFYRSELLSKISCFNEQFLGYFTDAPTNDGQAFIITHHANITNLSALSVLVEKNPSAIELSHEIDDHMLDQLIDHHVQSSDIPLMFQVYGPIEWMMSHYCPVGKNAKNCKACAQGAKTFKVSRNRDREYDMARLVLRPINCTSELFGSPKYDRSEMIQSFMRKGLNVLRLIRVLDESSQQVAKILSEIGAEA